MPTDQINPFPSWATDQEASPTRYSSIPTPCSMRHKSLFGLPLKSFITGEVVSDETLQAYIDQAVSELEHTLDLYITPVTFSEKHDYSRHQQFWSFGYFKVDHSPVLTVNRLTLTFNNNIGSVPLIDIPIEFVHVQPQEGTVQLVPANGVTISGFVVSLYTGLGYHAFNSQTLSHWPGAIHVEYTAGFPGGQLPALLSGLIENMAAYKFLSSLGPVLFPQNSVSIGIDGTSQSVGTLGPAFLENRLADLEKIIEKQMEAAKGYYQKRFLVDFL